MPVAVSAAADRFVKMDEWQHLGGICWWYFERGEGEQLRWSEMNDERQESVEVFTP